VTQAVRAARIVRAGVRRRWPGPVGPGPVCEAGREQLRQLQPKLLMIKENKCAKARGKTVVPENAL